MGTRADFYIKRENEIKWLGSVAWDGYDIHEMEELDSHTSAQNMSCWKVKQAKTEEEFQLAVNNYFSLRDDARLAEDGWPWPWEDSNTTDRAYVFDKDKVRFFAWGDEYTGLLNGDGDPVMEQPDFEWPDMKDIQNVTDGGFIILRG